MIYAFTGKTGTGKTFKMVQYAFKRWRKGENIYSNTILLFDKYIKPNWLEKLLKRKRGTITYFENIDEILEVKDGLILFDEAQVLFSARQWENLPMEFQYKLQQHRKHNLDLVCTTQNMGTIDITYRRLVHKWYHFENLIAFGKKKTYFGIYRRNEKDVDQLYNNVDDLTADTIKTKLFLITYFSTRIYDTLFDIGFKRYKTLWYGKENKLTSKTQAIGMIIPKEMSLNEGLRYLSSIR